MSEINGIVTELSDIHDGNAWHGQSLNEALAGLTHEEAAAHPVVGAHSIWEIVNHIAGWENIWRRRLSGDADATAPEEGDFPEVAEINESAWQATRARLNDTHKLLLEDAGDLTDNRLGTDLPNRDYSYRFLLRGAIRHHVYHTGQIAALRKAFVAT